MDTITMKRQLSEAIAAGERALSLLSDAEDALSGAAGWGLFDMLGGGFFSTLAKRSGMKDAKAKLEDAMQAIGDFQAELRDVRIDYDSELETGGFLSFADYVFDNAFVDFLVQRRINRARDGLRKTKRQVESIVGALREKRAEL